MEVDIMYNYGSGGLQPMQDPLKATANPLRDIGSFLLKGVAFLAPIAGAIIGTILFPGAGTLAGLGLGTMIGGAVGSAVGGLAGLGASSLEKAKYADAGNYLIAQNQQQTQQQQMMALQQMQMMSGVGYGFGGYGGNYAAPAATGNGSYAIQQYPYGSGFALGQ